MCVQRVLPRSYLLLGLAVSVATALGSAFEAQAQADLNIQSRLDTFTPPFVLSPAFTSSLVLPPEVSAALETLEKSGEPPNVCSKDWQVAWWLADRYIDIKLPKDLQGLGLEEFGRRLERPEDAALVLRDVLEQYKRLREEGKLREPLRTKAAINYPVGLCNARQQPSVKVSLPFNPTQESNVLKTTQNPHEDTSFGFGGSLQAITAGARAYDLMGLSIGSASARYDKFSSKSFDQLLIQGAYQFFISAAGYGKGGRPIDIDEDFVKNNKPELPAQNLITVTTLSLGFQNQRAYTPSFLLETADLITPQITISRQNISLFGADNVCEASLPDFRKSGFCYYADLSLTLGETFSDQSAQQNVNVAVSATLGKRFDQRDWKLALQTTVTERIYTDFHGGRRDVQLQVGPNLTYAVPTLVTPLGSAAVQFSLPATYNQNYSTLAKAEWHGVVVMPTLTLAFTPAAPAK